MRAEDFDKATIEELQAQANKCFELARSPLEEPIPLDQFTNVPTLDDAGKLRLLLEAQFYLTAVARKRDEQVAERDKQLSERSYKLEKWVLWLIGAEIVLSILGIVIGAWEGHAQSQVLDNISTSTSASASAMSAASTSLNTLAAQQTASVGQLQQMNTNLQNSSTKTGVMARASQKQLAILEDQQAKSLAEAARKPQLRLYVGSVLLNSASNTNLKSREETDTSVAFDVLFQNAGNKTATAPLLRIITSDKDIGVASSNGRVNQPELAPDMTGRVNLIQFDNMRAGISLSFELTISYSKGHHPFNVIFNCDADEIQTGTPIGSITVTPRQTTN
jgi:hypothetical protein